MSARSYWSVVCRKFDENCSRSSIDPSFLVQQLKSAHEIVRVADQRERISSRPGEKA